MKSSNERKCETCRFWVKGDLSPKNIGNVGNCVQLMPLTSGFYDRNLATPFWAQGLSHQTIGWQGKDCGAWVARRKPAADRRPVARREVAPRRAREPKRKRAAMCQSWPRCSCVLRGRVQDCSGGDGRHWVSRMLDP